MKSWNRSFRETKTYSLYGCNLIQAKPRTLTASEHLDRNNIIKPTDKYTTMLNEININNTSGIGKILFAKINDYVSKSYPHK